MRDLAHALRATDRSEQNSAPVVWISWTCIARKEGASTDSTAVICVLANSGASQRVYSYARFRAIRHRGLFACVVVLCGVLLRLEATRAARGDTVAGPSPHAERWVAVDGMFGSRCWIGAARDGRLCCWPGLVTPTRLRRLRAEADHGRARHGLTRRGFGASIRRPLDTRRIIGRGRPRGPGGTRYGRSSSATRSPARS